MTPIAGAMSGLIAYGLQKNVDNALGYRAWQWLFIIEGAITIFFALIIIALLPNLPDIVVEKGHFLFRHENERRIIAMRTRQSMFSPSLFQVTIWMVLDEEACRY